MVRRHEINASGNTKEMVATVPSYSFRSHIYHLISQSLVYGNNSLIKVCWKEKPNFEGESMYGSLVFNRLQQNANCVNNSNWNIDLITDWKFYWIWFNNLSKYKLLCHYRFDECNYELTDFTTHKNKQTNHFSFAHFRVCDWWSDGVMNIQTSIWSIVIMILFESHYVIPLLQAHESVWHLARCKCMSHLVYAYIEGYSD